MIAGASLSSDKITVLIFSFFAADANRLPNCPPPIIPRSGLGAKKGLVCGNLLGLIDSDYQGPLSISLWNRSNEPIKINAGERVAQLVVIRVNQVDLEEVDEFPETDRGSKGFGSTGIT